MALGADHVPGAPADNATVVMGNYWITYLVITALCMAWAIRLGRTRGDEDRIMDPTIVFLLWIIYSCIWLGIQIIFR